MNFTKTDLLRETTFKASRSGGKGGQNVNKVSTKVELGFDVRTSALFTDVQKDLILSKLVNRLNKEGEVQVICDEERSQYLNREKAIEKLFNLLHKALEQPKLRKPTKVSRAVKAARSAAKRIQSAKKETRRRNFND